MLLAQLTDYRHGTPRLSSANVSRVAGTVVQLQLAGATTVTSTALATDTPLVRLVRSLGSVEAMRALRPHIVRSLHERAAKDGIRGLLQLWQPLMAVETHARATTPANASMLQVFVGTSHTVSALLTPVPPPPQKPCCQRCCMLCNMPQPTLLPKPWRACWCTTPCCWYQLPVWSQVSKASQSWRSMWAT